MIHLFKLLPVYPVYLVLFATFGPLLVIKLAWYQQLMDFALTSSFLYIHNPRSPETFDFIVVGGGSAGAAVAARLSEAFRVCLIEAGGDPPILSYIPAANPVHLSQPIVDWEYYVKLNGSGYAWRDQEMPWPRGRSLGGSSNHNWMQYMRGNPNDFDLWANLTGDIRWNYQNVLQYFRRLEDYHGHWKGSEAYHGEGGPMNIEGLSFKPALKYWLAAAEELGYPTGFDPNAIQTQGFGPFDVTQKRGVRFSTYRGYIVPNLLNKNLVIRRYAYATKIHFDETMTATGVSYLHHGIPKFAAATKEVVVCAGAINTPQLLLLSGIGPFEHLKEVGIRPVVNLPVGLNLQDHVSAVGHFLADSPVSFIPNRDSSLASGLEYLLYGTGPLTSAAGMGGYGFYSTPKTSPDWPNIFYILTSIGNFKDFGKLQDLLGPYSTNFWEQWMKPTEPSDAHLIWVLLARPKSRGYIKLADANPMSKPIIQPAYFSDSGDEDVEALIDGLQFLVKMYEGTSAFQVAGGRMNPVPMPGCENYIFKSRRYFECVIKTLPQTIYHPSCTCPMGKVGDPRAVLDSELRVIGTRGLRVADASVMPVITNANLNAPTIMIGERCADLIKSTWLPTVTL